MTGANIASDPSSRNTFSDPSRETSTRTSGPAAFCRIAGFAVSANGSTAGTLIVSPRGESRAGVQLLDQRRRRVESLAEALEERLVSERGQLRLCDEIVGNRLGKRTGTIIRRDRVVDQDRLPPSALRVAQSVVPVGGSPFASWNALSARVVFAPARPSISPGEKPLRSSSTWKATMS